MKETNLKAEVEQLVNEIDKTHRYSMSRIYELSNRVFLKDEVPQSCASCLIRKTRELRNWLDTQNRAEAVAGESIQKEKVKRVKNNKAKG